MRRQGIALGAVALTLQLATLSLVLTTLTLTACSSSSVSDGAEVGAGDVADAVDAGPDTLPGRPCTSNEQCAGAFPDLGVCEVASCDGTTKRCARGRVKDGTACDDGDPCTVETVCDAGACGGGEALTCDDGDPCTVDACDAAGGCVATPLDEGDCDDGDACTTGDHCTGGACVGESLACDDGDPCTTDRCDAADGCVYEAASGAACDDGDDCTDGDVCADGACLSGAAIECADDDPCTDDSCLADGGCQNVWRADDPLCNCTAAADCDDGEDCTVDACEDDGRCSYATRADDETCEDGDPCTENGTCDDGQCGGDPVDCEDDSLCTADSCDPVEGCRHEPIPGCLCAGDADCPDGACTVGHCDPATLRCTNDLVPAGTVCEDGNPCTVDTACDAAGACVGSPRDCADGVDCTTDFCVPGSGCVNEASGCECDLDAGRGCDDDNPCTDDACVDFDCTSEPVADGTACPDDGDECTTDHACDAGVCGFATYVCPELLCSDDSDDDYDGATDCDDADCDADPACTESDCSDGLDSDRDGNTDCDDADCNDAPNCNPEVACRDAVDNDEDGLTDCDDPNCEDAPSCNPEGDCRDGADDDLDGATDCDDDDCDADPSCNPEADCRNDADDDFDGFTDCDDDDCEGAANCVPEADCDNGVDDDLDGATDCDDGDCALAQTCAELNCLDGIDGDQDGQTDCDDVDCATLDACVTCEPVATVACGGSYSGTTAGGAALAAAYPACTKGATAFEGPEGVIVFEPPVSGVATITVEAQFDAAVVVLERDCRPGTNCATAVDTAHGLETARVDVVGGRRYYVLVDGDDANDQGPYTVSVACPQLVEDCRNGEDDDDDGLVDCDDPGCATSPACTELNCSDETDNDGDGLADCADPDCAATFACSSCSPRQTLSCGSVITDTTAGTQNLLDRYPSCTSSIYNGPEHVYAFTPTYDLEATFEVAPGEHDAALLLLEGECNDANACIARRDAAFFGEPETLAVDLRAGTTYYLIVDSFAPFSFGDFQLSVLCSSPPELCDNGVDDDEDGLGDCLDDDCEGQRCNDGDACSLGDVCSLGACIGPFDLACDDGNDCTDDTCAPATGCVHVPELAGAPCTLPLPGVCDDAGVCRQTALTGAIIVSEIMKDPGCAAGVAGEWFEVHNTTDRPYDLFGWQLTSAGDTTHRLQRSVVVPALGFGVLCHDEDADANGDIRNCLYGYGDALVLDDDGADSLVLLDPNGNEVDRVVWDDSGDFPDVPGASLSLDALALDGASNDVGANWCAGRDAVGGCADAPDLGTPGQPNPLCAGDVCALAQPIGCGDTVAGDTSGLPSILGGYACTGRAQTGGERVFAFTADDRIRVRAALAPADGVDLDIDVLRQSCDPAECAGFGDESVEFLTSAFTTYYFVVDGFAGARGAFELTLTCDDASIENCGNRQDDDDDGLTDCDDMDCDEDPFCTEFCVPSGLALTCDRVVGGSTFGRPNDITTYDCTGDLAGGGELAYTFVATEAAEVTFTLSYEAAAFLDLYVLEGTCGDTTCVAQGDRSATLVTQAGRTYYVVVDGRGGSVGDFALATDCEGGVVVETVCDDGVDGDGDGLIDCRDADCRFHPRCHERACDDGLDDDGDGLVDCDDPDCLQTRACFACVDAVPLRCGKVLSGDTTGRRDRLDGYGCGDRDASGGERVFAVTPEGTGTATATLSAVTGGDLDLYVLREACTPAECLASGDVGATFDVAYGQVVYLVVDGVDGDAGTFEIELECDVVPPEACTGGADEDQDGLVDCDDPDCDGRAGCAELLCRDGLDDEGDGLVDCDDPDCATARVCNACAEAVELVCGDLVLGTTAGIDDALSGYGCVDWDESGGEAVYRFHAAQTVEVLVDLGSFEDDLDVLVLEGACDPSACVASGVQGALFTAVAGRDYLVVVDGFGGVGGAFRLSVGCAGVTETCGDGRDNDGDGDTDCDDADCAGNPACPEICDDGIDNDGDHRADCIDPDCDIDPHCAELCETDLVVDCGDVVSGTTVGEPNEIQTWQGCAVLTATGGEATHELVVPGPRTVTARITSAAELVLFATGEACADRRCVAFGGGDDELTFQAEPETSYFIVVDGFLGATGTYQLTVTCSATAEDQCGDGVDEDHDGVTDCDDDDCGADAACVVLEDCANGDDDDGDGAVDCADADCAEVLACLEECTPAVTGACDVLFRGGTLGATNEISFHPTCVDWDEAGGEFVYRLTVAADTTLSARLENVSGGELDLFLLEGDCDTTACVAYGDELLTAPLTAGRTYYVVVDGYAGDAGLFDLRLDCGGDDQGCFAPADCVRAECEAAPLCQPEAACQNGIDDDGDGATDCTDADCTDDPGCGPAPEVCTDFVDNDGDDLVDCLDDDCLFHPACDVACPTPIETLDCDTAVSGTTAGGSAGLDWYPFCTDRLLDGPERIYAVTPPSPTRLSARLADTTADLDVVILYGPCGAYSCGDGWGDDAASNEVLGGQTYYVVVDGFDGAEGDYTLRVQCALDREVFCDDGVDDDENGATDCDDATCAADPACTAGTEVACADGVDDDADGATDCTDDDCWGEAACTCQPAPAALASCGDLLVGDIPPGPSLYDGYPCAPGVPALGPELVYAFTVDNPEAVTFQNLSAPNSQVYVLEADCNPGTCVAATSAPPAAFTAMPGTTYYLVVEEAPDFAGQYLVLVNCAPL